MLVNVQDISQMGEKLKSENLPLDSRVVFRDIVFEINSCVKS